MIDLSPAPVLVLQAYRERQEAVRARLGLQLEPTDLILAHADGSPMLPESVSHGVKRILIKAGYPELSLHDLRHTHSSLLLQLGAHLKVVQERLGHSTITTTADIYSHVLPGIQRRLR